MHHKMATTAGKQVYSYEYKVLVIGDQAVGKTSIIKRYVHQFFSPYYKTTIGVDFSSMKVLNWDCRTSVRLQLWDIAGQESFGSMTRVYYKNAVGAFVVFDVTRLSTFEAVQTWKADLDNKVLLPDGTPIPTVLLANKCDLPSVGFLGNENQLDKYCQDKGFHAWFKTSAKENIGIEEAARCLTAKILEKGESIEHPQSDPDGIILKADPVTEKRRCCS